MPATSQVSHMSAQAIDIRTFRRKGAYPVQMGKRTSLILETRLLQSAADVLGTKGATATVREALERVVRQAALESLANWEFPDDALDRLREMRKPRKFDFE